MSLARFARLERLFDRIVPLAMIALSISLAAATVSVGA